MFESTPSLEESTDGVIIYAEGSAKKSETNIYHLMITGLNRQNIFVDDEDIERFIDKLAKYHAAKATRNPAPCLTNRKNAWFWVGPA